MQYTKSRSGFTLVELLVVMGIFMALAGMVVGFLRVQDAERTASGASALQGALQISRQRALRDQAPRGVRLVANANGMVTELQYIEQPGDYSPTPGGPGGPGPLSMLFINDPDPTVVQPAPPAQPYLLVRFQNVDLTNGDSTFTYSSVQPGDYLELYGGGLVHRINNIFAPGSTSLPAALTTTYPNDSFVQLVTPLSQPRTVGTLNYRIIRQARLSGEESVRLPNNVVIDANINMMAAATGYNNPLPAGPNAFSFDILFSPDGRVISPGISTPFIALWVRDITDDPSSINYPALQFYQQSMPAIIGINVQTGLIAAHDPAVNSADPYLFFKDGRTEK